MDKACLDNEWGIHVVMLFSRGNSVIVVYQSYSFCLHEACFIIFLILLIELKIRKKYLQHGFNALLLAVKDGRLDVFKKMTSLGADINVVTKVTSEHVYKPIFLF